MACLCNCGTPECEGDNVCQRCLCCPLCCECYADETYEDEYVNAGEQ